MKRRAPTQPRPKAAAPAPPLPTWTRRLTQIAFVLALGLVAARATILETLREPFEVTPGAELLPAGPGPATSLWLDLLCCVPAVLILLRRLFDRSYRLNFSLAHALLLGFGIWAFLSTFWGPDSFASLLGSYHLLAAAALMWAGTQLVRSWLRLRIVAGFAFGLLMVFVAQGLIYQFVDLPELQRTWAEQKDEILAQRGWSPDSFPARQFENKIMNGEMVGFSGSANTFAAAIVMLTLISAGIAIQRISDRDDPTWPAGPVVVALLGLYILSRTQSRTAFAVLVLGGVALGAIGRMRPWLARCSRRGYWMGLGLTLLGIAAIVGHGLYHQSLVIRSLTFRWRYWTAGWRIFEDHPLVGVGWDNFSFFYLVHRLAEAAEEVRDPHNMVVRAFVELGLVGGVLFVGWLARSWWEATRPITPPDQTLSWPQYRGFQRAVAALLWIAGAATLVVIFTAIDFSQQSDFVLSELSKRMLYGALLFGGMVIASLRSLERQELDSRPAPWVLYGLLVGIGGFLLIGMVDVAPFEIGPLMLLAILVGSVLGVRREPDDVTTPRPRLALAGLGASAVGIVATATFLATPLTQAQAQAALGDELLRTGEFTDAAVAYHAAYADVPINAEYAYNAARALSYGRQIDAARTMMDLAIRTNPMDSALYRGRASIHLLGPEPDQEAVIRDYNVALALNPRDIMLRLDFAQVLADFDRPDAAVEQYRLALDQNAAYPPDEAERLQDEMVADIEARIRDLTTP